jgi:heterodisulfide reductase subunit B
VKYTHFPGCSLEATVTGYGTSFSAVLQALDIEVEELPDWNCCGSPEYFAIDEVASLCLAGRNLALAEQRGLDLVASCTACYAHLDKTNRYIRGMPAVKDKVDEALRAGGLEYQGTVRVRHLTEILLDSACLEIISSRVKRPLNGLLVATYYGCSLIRSDADIGVSGLVHSLDQLITNLGATPVPFPLMNRCCGGMLFGGEEDIALSMLNKLLLSIVDCQAQIIVCICPLCHLNLDAYQSRANRLFSTGYQIPALFVTQLIGVALGLDANSLGIDRNIISPRSILAPYI